MPKRELTMGAENFIRAVNDFIFVKDEPAKADVIFIPGNSSPEHALHAAKLYHQGYAPYLLPSGRYSKVMGRFAGVEEGWKHIYSDDYETEWAYLRDVLRREGVPDSAILREDQATYTWDNAVQSRKVTDAMGLQVKKAILCCRCMHARRALMYYQAAYPETEFITCPVDIPGYSASDWYMTRDGQNMILGEVRRLGDQVNDVFAMMLEQNPAGER